MKRVESKVYTMRMQRTGGEEKLQNQLDNGWRVIHATPLQVGGYTEAIIYVLERTFD